mmetsp:Transcript_13076/g.29672  ORF Transcript_13076/g.29672 Transcript_13076/m.29672 type:complete len:249 (-) Transcript_13076:1038-1784(-)
MPCRWPPACLRGWRACVARSQTPPMRWSRRRLPSLSSFREARKVDRPCGWCSFRTWQGGAASRTSRRSLRRCGRASCRRLSRSSSWRTSMLPPGPRAAARSRRRSWPQAAYCWQSLTRSRRLLEVGRPPLGGTSSCRSSTRWSLWRTCASSWLPRSSTRRPSTRCGVRSSRSRCLCWPPSWLAPRRVARSPRSTLAMSTSRLLSGSTLRRHWTTTARPLPQAPRASSVARASSIACVQRRRLVQRLAR